MNIPAATDKSAAPELVHVGKVTVLAVIAALGGFLFGYDSSVINGANKAIYAQFNITDGFFQGFVVSVALLGSAVGAFVGGRLAEKYGRKRVMLVAAILFLVAGLGSAFPFTIYDFMAWRVVGGFAIGLAAIVSPMYIAEIAPAHMRGRLSSLFQFAIVIGIFATQVVNQIVLNLADGSSSNDLGPIQAWQWMFVLMAVPATIYFFCAFTLPESPRYLVAINAGDRAKTVLESIFIEPVESKITAIRESLDSEQKSSLSDLRAKGTFFLPLVWVGLALAIFQQFVGINAVFYYSNTIWQSVGFTEDQAFQTSLITTGVNVAFTVVAIALVDRVGRKPLLLVGSVGMVVTLAVLTFVFGTAPVGADGSPILNNGPDIVAVLSFNIYVAFFAATWGPVVWVLLGEMFPNRIRAAALALAVAAQWTANFIVSTAFPPIAGKSLGIAYGIFTVFAILSIPFVMRKIKETKGIELEDMDDLEASSMLPG